MNTQRPSKEIHWTGRDKCAPWHEYGEYRTAAIERIPNIGYMAPRLDLSHSRYETEVEIMRAVDQYIRACNEDAKAAEAQP